MWGGGCLQPSWLWCKYQGIMSVSCLADRSALPALILRVQEAEGARLALDSSREASTVVGPPPRPTCGDQDAPLSSRRGVSGPAASF